MSERVKRWTKGDWAVVNNRYYFEIVAPHDDGQMREIGNVCASQHWSDGGDHKTGGESEANAHLISAAPALVEALELAEGVIAAVVNDRIMSKRNHAHAEAVSHEIEARLALAYGETQ